MQFKVDENLPEELTQLFREAGWDATIGGADDPRIEEICDAENRILVTFDRGCVRAGGTPGLYRVSPQKPR
jgi:uncharacterized protein with PIN domain